MRPAIPEPSRLTIADLIADLSWASIADARIQHVATDRCYDVVEPVGAGLFALVVERRSKVVRHIVKPDVEVRLVGWQRRPIDWSPRLVA